MDRVFSADPSDYRRAAPAAGEGDVSLRLGHLWLPAGIARDVFGTDRQVYTVYYPERGHLLLAPMSDTAFKSLHKCSLAMLKVRNVAGDASLSLQELLIDNDLDDSDRSLAHEQPSGMSLLKIELF